MIKLSLWLLTISLLGQTSFSQVSDLRRKIEVTGTAETEIVPDIIYIGLSLKEYYSGNKKLADIRDLEKQLQQAAAQAGIPKDNLTVNEISSFRQTWERKKNPLFAASKQYRIKVSDPALFDKVLSALDPKAVEYTQIDGYEHSKIVELKQALRIKALQAAKQKASYLAEVVNDTVGDALNIEEMNTEENPPPYPVSPYSNVIMSKVAAESSPGADDIGFKTIKLKSQVKVIFQLN